nr:MAG TPA: hypothetical protein [Caudoviricetes sp.]
MARDNHLTGKPARYKPPAWENPNFAIFKVRLLPGALFPWPLGVTT